MDRTPETLTQKLKRTGFIEDEDSDVESVATVSTVPTWASDKEYEVEKVVAEKFDDSTRRSMLLIAWRGYPMSAYSWEPKNVQSRIVLHGWELRQQKIEQNLEDAFNLKKWEEQVASKKLKRHTRRAQKRWQQRLPLDNVQYIYDRYPTLFKEQDRPQSKTATNGEFIAKKDVAKAKPSPSKKTPPPRTVSGFGAYLSDDDSDVPLSTLRMQTHSTPAKKDVVKPASKPQTPIAKKPSDGKNKPPQAREAQRAANTAALSEKLGMKPQASMVRQPPAVTPTSGRQKFDALPSKAAILVENTGNKTEELMVKKTSAAPQALIREDSINLRSSGELSLLTRSTTMPLPPTPPVLPVPQRNLTSPLVVKKSDPVKKPFTMIYDTTDNGKSRKRKATEPIINPPFANLSHANNVLKKQRREANRIPSSNVIQLFVPASAALAMKPAVIEHTTQTETQRIPVARPTITTASTASSKEHNSHIIPSAVSTYEQHTKLTGFLPLTCPYWDAKEPCPKGPSCFFRHKETGKIASRVLYSQAEAESTCQGTFAGKFGFFRPTQVCDFHRAGHCKNSEEKCWWAHWVSDLRPTIAHIPMFPSKFKPNKTCLYWAKGSCKFTAEDCQFIHEDTGIVAHPPGWIHEDTSAATPTFTFPPKSLLKQDKTCTFWVDGSCRYTAEQCQFKHENTGIIAHPPGWREKNQYTKSDWADSGDMDLDTMQARRLSKMSSHHLSAISTANRPSTNSVYSGDIPETTKAKLQLLVHTMEASWTLPSQIAMLLRQSGGICNLDFGVSANDLVTSSGDLQAPLASGDLTKLSGDVSRFEDLIFWMKSYSTGAWHALQNSSFGFLFIPAKQKCWQFLPDAETKDAKEISILFYVFRTQYMKVYLQNIPAALANLDADMERINSKIPAGSKGPDYFFQGYNKTLLKKVFVIGQGTKTPFSKSIVRYFRKASAEVFTDWDAFKAKRSGVILIDWSAPLEIIKSLAGFSACVLGSFNVFRMGLEGEQFHCQKICGNGSVIHITKAVFVDEIEAGKDILEHYLAKFVSDRKNVRKSWKLYLQCPALKLFSELIAIANSHGKNTAPTAVIFDLLEVIRKRSENYKKEDPLLLTPNGEESEIVADEVTINDFCDWALGALENSRRMIVVTTIAQSNQADIMQLRKANQHVIFYTAEKFAQKLVNW